MKNVGILGSGYDAPKETFPQENNNRDLLCRAINGPGYIFHEYWLLDASNFYGFVYAPLIH